jgi:epoxyqueuosine reductase
MAKSTPRKTQYHSTISRRDFMKMIGMGVAGAGALSLGVPMTEPFKDLDEMMASPAAQRKLPSWVKEVDKPTVEIDWENMEIYPGMQNTMFNPMNFGLEDAGKLMQKHLEDVTTKIKNKVPGYTLKDHALGSSSSWGWQGGDLTPSWTGPEMPSKLKDFGHITTFATPEQMGVPRYDGTPEENSRMLRVAGRIMGAADMGFVKLDKNTKKLLYGNVIFEDVEKGYADPEKMTQVLPNKDLWVICSVIPQSLAMGQLTDRMSWVGANAYAYSRANIYSNRIKVFLDGLGYQHYGGNTASVGRAIGFGVMAGLAEYSRATLMVSPQFGTSFRTVMLTITDLPLAVTKPIDAGITNFCRTCKKCGEQCPSGAISMDDEPAWATWETGTRPWQAKGIKGWYLEPKKCLTHMFGSEPDCSRCQVTCPFNKFDEAVLHDLVKASISSAPMLNGMIRKLDDVFGYGTEKGTDMWDRDPWDIPLFGLDPSRS